MTEQSDNITTAHLSPMSEEEALEIIEASVGSKPYVTILAIIKNLKAENKRLQQENDRLRQQTKEWVEEFFRNTQFDVSDSTIPDPPYTADSSKDKVSRLKRKIDQLREARDEMLDRPKRIPRFNRPGSIDDSGR